MEKGDFVYASKDLSAGFFSGSTIKKGTRGSVVAFQGDFPARVAFPIGKGEKVDIVEVTVRKGDLV